MTFCKFCDTLYNLDKFIGIEVVDNSDNDFNTISILFRFEGDYLHSNDDEHTPYSFSINMTDHMIRTQHLEISDVENYFENDIHSVLELLVDEFVEEFERELINTPVNENCVIDLGSIERGVLMEVKKKVNKSK